VINPIDADELRRKVRAATPFPHCCIDNFLAEDFAARVRAAFPPFEAALKMGRVFNTVNEKKKVQITDSTMFPVPIAELNHLLAAREFLELLSYAFEIPKLLPDAELIGGGIHQTGPRGRLDVHVDFNYIAERELHRRLNILIYFNPDWKSAWGGNLELWDNGVQRCRHSFAPEMNRCVIFETSDISYHGVTAVNCPPDRVRCSIAAYYYTREAPAHWAGRANPTLFRSRPDEVMKAAVLMPAERAGLRIRGAVYGLRRGVKRFLIGLGQRPR
jgi:hypothetical protein